MIRALAGVVVALGIAGCGPDANDPLSRLTVYDEPSGIYRLRYLEPPWKLERAEGTAATLRVISNTERYLGEDLLDSDVFVPQKYWLEVTVEAGNTLARATADQSAVGGRGETLVEGVREVETSTGDTGHEVLTHVEMPFARNRRYVYLARTGGVVRLFFEANPSLDEPEVDEMIRAFEVEPDR